MEWKIRSTCVLNAFVRVMNQITTDRDIILETLRQNRAMMESLGYDVRLTYEKQDTVE